MTGGALYSGGLVLQYFWFLLQAISSCIYNTVGSWQQEPKLTGLLSPWTGSLFPFGNLEGPAPQAFCLPILFSSSTRTAAMKSDFAGACFGLNAHPAEVGPCCTMLPLYVTYKEAKGISEACRYFKQQTRPQCCSASRQKHFNVSEKTKEKPP